MTAQPEDAAHGPGACSLARPDDEGKATIHRRTSPVLELPGNSHERTLVGADLTIDDFYTLHTFARRSAMFTLHDLVERARTAGGGQA